MRKILFALLLATPASAAPVPKESKKDDAGRFVGEWWESRQDNATYTDAAVARRFTFDAEGGLGIRQNAGAAPSDYTVAIDRTTAVPTFLLKAKVGGTSYIASYRLDADTLAFALTDPGKPLAEIKPSAGGIFYELKRLR